MVSRYLSTVVGEDSGQFYTPVACFVIANDNSLSVSDVINTPGLELLLTIIYAGLNIS
jgi:hypothetical protein